jgi:transcriptional regulator with GAF, ATPase, and Fis domain
MEHSAWLRSFGRAEGSWPTAFVGDCVPAEPHRTDSSGPGVVVFDQVEPVVLGFIERASRCGRERVLAIATGDCHSSDVYRLLAAGAADVLPLALVADAAAAVAARLERWQQVDTLLASREVSLRLVGSSQTWWRALRLVVEVARYTEAAVLLSGESGTGKELVARLIHELGAGGGSGPFEVVDCTTIVPELSGSEFFGHERGAFTGAVGEREGAFARADGGTLFLDEIGELPLPLQAQLLRVIQEGTYKRVGGNTWYRTRFRLVSATHRDLAAQVRTGGFRGDLFFRIADVPISLPPLRDRPADILPLARHFIAQACHGRPPPGLDPVVVEFLLGRSYPGNIRELRQVISRLLHRWTGVGPLTAGCIPEGDRPEPMAGPVAPGGSPLAGAVRAMLASGLGLREIGRQAEEMALRLVMEDEGGNLQRAARRLGVTDRALQLRRQCERRRNGGAP